MRKFIRNDYTFIKRLERLQNTYRTKDRGGSISSDLSSKGHRMYCRINRWIDDIKEDMRLNALQNINDSGEWKKEYDCIFNK
jgi:hypothetical protein